MFAAIAQSVGADKAALSRQWEDVLPRAVLAAGSSSSGMVNKDVWAKAISNINKHGATARAHPTDAFMAGLVEWTAFGISSSGVETHFSKHALTCGHRRQSAFPDTEQLHAKLSLDIQHHDRAQPANVPHTCMMPTTMLTMLWGSKP